MSEEILKNYEKLECLGEGSVIKTVEYYKIKQYARVYKARNKITNEIVAIKKVYKKNNKLK